jgi:hypothetical protein
MRNRHFVCYVFENISKEKYKMMVKVTHRLRKKKAVVKNVTVTRKVVHMTAATATATATGIRK